MERVSEYVQRRLRENEDVLEGAPLAVKRFFALDQDVYADGALSKTTKELLGLVASTVLRCNDCISYHLIEAVASGASDEEIEEALGVAMIVGGSITIPHLRHAKAFLKTIDRSQAPA